jgi:diguanylate cyclase (GGDEF)-like protein/PAS domain S-box-containing protein
MRQFNLLTKYLLVGVLLSIVLVAITALTLYTTYRSSLSQAITTSLVTNSSVFGENLTQQATNFSHRLATQLAGPATRQDYEKLDQIMGQARSINGALLIAFSDNNGRTVRFAGDIDQLGAKKATENGSGSGSQKISVQVPVVFEDETIGTLTQIFDAAEIAETAKTIRNQLDFIRSEYETNSLVFGLAIALLAVFFTSAIATAVAYGQVKSIRALASNAAKFAEGQHGENLPVMGNDELGQLAIAFNQMRDKLRTTTVSRDFLDNVLTSMNDAIILITENGHITRVNEAAHRLLGYSDTELLEKSINTFISPEYAERFEFANRQLRPKETVFINKAGDEIPISYSSSEIDSDDPSYQRYIIVARNIADRKMAERRIRYLARIDALTRVPNRMQFQHLLQRSIARARRSKTNLALLYVDVDRFKDINDTFGHAAGDTCLETLAERVTQVVPDDTTVGRLAGDEFGIVLDSVTPNDNQTAYIQKIAQQILSAINELLIVQGHEIYMNVSVGIACYPLDANNVLDLIRNADAALYHAKRAGGNRVEFYQPSMNAEAVEKLMLKSKLRRSYELDELLMNYQPKINLKTGEIVGAEALVRWELSEHGLVLPSEFIPLAEETNLILEIGEWVLNKVCEDYRGWQRKIGNPGRISVNLSLKQLNQPNFIKRVNRIFRRNSLSPSCLELEITESTLMKDAERTIKILGELHDMGLHLAIDDFGTGYSSLSALQQFPISTLKIDKSFVAHAGVNPDDATIVSTIIDMGHSLKLEVVAEGVESEEQLDFLKTLDCDYVQGLLFGKPMTADDYLALILSQHSGTKSYKTLFL